MSYARKPRKAFQPETFEQVRRRAWRYQITQAVKKAYGGNTLPLYNALCSSGEESQYHFVALAEFIMRRSNGANKQAPNDEHMVAALVKAQLKYLRRRNGGKTLPRGTHDRVVRRFLALLEEDCGVSWATVTPERFQRLKKKDKDELYDEEFEHEERIRRIKTAVGRGNRRA